MSLAEDIVREVRRWADAKVPYRHMGTSTSGCDCTGLLVGIARQFGFLQKFKLPYYPPDWNLHSNNPNFLTSYLPKYADEIPKLDVQPGDIILFRFGHRISHAGIFIGNDLFVHTYATRHTWYGRLKDSMWSKRWVATYRLNEKNLANS